MLGRRAILLGTAGAIAAAAAPQIGAATVATAAGGGAAYHYLFVELADGEPAAGQKAFLAALRASAPLQSSGGQVLAVFLPQLGWTTHHLAVLVRWPNGATGQDGVLDALMRDPSVKSLERHPMEATLRPSATSLPKKEGIFTNRWFEVRNADVPEFIDLSGRGWSDFEKRFDTTIFGLFKVRPTADDQARAVSRILLMTQYGSHAVWEASRDPTTDAMQLFARRAQITLHSRVASMKLVTV